MSDASVRKKLGDPIVLCIIAIAFLILSLVLRITGAIVHELTRVESTQTCTAEVVGQTTTITCHPRAGEQ